MSSVVAIGTGAFLVVGLVMGILCLGLYGKSYPTMRRKESIT